METRVLPPTPETIAQAAAALRHGDLVGIPTETVYGLAGNALDAHALASIFAAKERPSFDPLIVHIGGAIDATGLVDLSAFGACARDRLRALVDAFWPGPLTLVLPKTPMVPDLATSGLATIALRAPSHPVARALIAAAGVPLAAPSANRFGRISPTTASDVVQELWGRVSMVIDGGPCAVGVESTVVAIDPEGGLRLLRPGGISRESLIAVTGAPVAVVPRVVGPGAPARSPGMLESHYAPVKPLHLLPRAILALNDVERRELLPAGAGILAASGDAEAIAAACAGPPTILRVLSPSGDAEEAARNLFAALRALDASEATTLVTEPWPGEEGLGYAIADRLRRATAVK
ncbi:MAG TPA: L-threonylcarbamoyladenylate synthase [Candidatus Polarisedimenticolaceae bacterium]